MKLQYYAFLLFLIWGGGKNGSCIGLTPSLHQ